MLIRLAFSFCFCFFFGFIQRKSRDFPIPILFSKSLKQSVLLLFLSKRGKKKKKTRPPWFLTIMNLINSVALGGLFLGWWWISTNFNFLFWLTIQREVSWYVFSFYSDFFHDLIKIVDSLNDDMIVESKWRIWHKTCSSYIILS